MKIRFWYQYIVIAKTLNCHNSFIFNCYYICAINLTDLLHFSSDSRASLLMGRLGCTIITTDTMIQKARGFSIKDLLPNSIKCNMTNCIAHNDKNPSMRIKDNRALCFSCGFKGDVIEVYMRLNGVDFKTAVKNLN